MTNKPIELEELISELAKDILTNKGEPFTYEICPYFKDCGRKVMKICLSNYDTCSHYLHRFNIQDRKWNGNK